MKNINIRIQCIINNIFYALDRYYEHNAGQPLW